MTTEGEEGEEYNEKEEEKDEGMYVNTLYLP
jgi:hypothetical protein